MISVKSCRRTCLGRSGGANQIEENNFQVLYGKNFFVFFTTAMQSLDTRLVLFCSALDARSNEVSDAAWRAVVAEIGNFGPSIFG